MHRRVMLVALAGSAAAFMPGAFVGSAPALAKATSGEPPRCRRPPRRSKRREKTSQFFLTICRATRQACALCAAAAPASRWWTGTGTRKRRRTSTTAPARSVARSLRMLLLADVAARPRHCDRSSLCTSRFFSDSSLFLSISLFSLSLSPPPVSAPSSFSSPFLSLCRVSLTLQLPADQQVG